MSVRNWKQVGPVAMGLVTGAGLVAGCGAHTGESTAAFQRMAAEFAPLAQARAQAALLQAPAAAQAASAAALPALAASSAQPPAVAPAPPLAVATLPVGALAAPMAPVPALPAAAAPAAPTPATPAALAVVPELGLPAAASAPGAAPAASSVAPPVVAPPPPPHPEAAPILASLMGLPAPTPNAKVLFAPGLAGEGVAWKALGRGAEALIGSAGYGAKRSAALSMNESLRLEGWQKPTLELKLAAGAGALRLVWASEGALPEEHALGAKFSPGPDGLEATVELGDYASRPGRLILVAKGEEGQAPLRLLALTLRESPQATTQAAVGQLASR